MPSLKSRMLKLALRRIAGLVPTLLVIITLSFAIVRLAPGGPFDQEQALSAPVRANLERLYGLDRPLAVQYVRYVRGLLHGDFGPSLRQRDFMVSELIGQGLPLSATLGLAAILLALLLGIPAGGAARPGQRANPVAPRAAPGAPARGELPGSRGGVRGDRLARGGDGVRTAGHRA